MRSRFVLITVFVVRAFGALGSVLLSVVVGRKFGADALGQFAVFMGIVGFCSILARHGNRMTIMREVAHLRSGRERDERTAVIALASRMILPGTVGATLLGAVLVASGILGPPLEGAPLAFVVVLPATTFLALVSGYVKGVGSPWLFPIFETGGFSFLACVILLMILWSGAPATGPVLFASIVAALGVLMYFAIHVWRRGLPAGGSLLALPKVSPTLRSGLVRGQWDFMIIGLTAFLTQAGAFVAAGPFLDPAEIGTIRAAERIAILVSFSILVVDPVISPRIVQRFENGDRTGVRRVLRNAMTAGTMFALPVLAALLLWPTYFLGLIGEEFVGGALYLRVMALAHFCLALLGGFQTSLTMTGGERSAMALASTFLVLSLIAFPAMAVFAGPIGFVGAYAVLLVARSVANVVLALRQLRQVPTVSGV